MNEADSPLNQAFAQAADNPEDFDFGFVQERAETCDLANFNFPPDEAALMREKELARIAAELEAEPMDYYDDEFEDDDISDRDEFDDEEWDDDDQWETLDDDYDDEDDYDRFEESYGFDDDDEDDYE